MKKNQISPWVIISSFINLFKNLKNTLVKFQFGSLLNLSLIQVRRFPLLTAISTSIKANTLWAYKFIATSKEWKPRFGEKCTQMIYNTILASVLLLFISSCAKDPVGPIDDDGSNAEEYLISFTIDGFTQDLLPFSNKIQAYDLNASTSRNSNSSLFSNSVQNTEEQTDIRDFINTIEIKVYNGATLVDSIRQYAEHSDFGKFAKYYKNNNPHNVFIVGAMLGDNGDFIMRKETPATTVRDVYLKVLPQPTDAFSFYKSYDFKKEPQHENLKLKRFVGRVEVHLDEQIPSDADRIEITIENTAEYYLPSYQRGYHLSRVIALDTIPYHTNKTIQIKPEDIGRTDLSVSAYFVLKSELGSVPDTTKVILAAYRQNGTLIQRREIPNVIVQANKRTKLIGKLFSVPNIDFDVALENDWSSDIPEYEF